MDAEPVTPDAFLGSQIPELPPELQILRTSAGKTCAAPTSIQYPHRHSASRRSARGTHPWPIRRPARFACPASSAVTRSIPPPKGSKPRSAAFPQTHPFGPRSSEEPRFPPGRRSEFLAGESLECETPPSFLRPEPAEANIWAERAPRRVRATGKTADLRNGAFPTGRPLIVTFRRSSRPSDHPAVPGTRRVVAHVPDRALERTSTEAIDPEGPCPSADFPPDLASPCGNPAGPASVSVDPVRPLVTVPNPPEPTAERMARTRRKPVDTSMRTQTCSTAATEAAMCNRGQHPVSCAKLSQ